MTFRNVVATQSTYLLGINHYNAKLKYEHSTKSTAWGQKDAESEELEEKLIITLLSLWEIA